MNTSVFVVVLAAIAVLVLFAARRLFRKGRDENNSAHTSDLNRRMRELNARIASAKESGDLIDVLAPDIAIDDALRMLRLQYPDATIGSMFERLTGRFEQTGHPPYLAILAGLALEEPERVRNGKLIRDAVARVLAMAPSPLLLDFINHAGSDDEALDRWGWIAGEGRPLLQTIDWMKTEDPANAASLERLNARMLERRITRQIEEAESQIAFYRGRADMEDSYLLAMQLASWSLLPAPGLADRIETLASENSVFAPWRVLRLQMDLIRIEHDRHPDTEAAIARIEFAFSDDDPSVTEMAGEVAAALLEQSCLDKAFRDRMRAALSAAMVCKNAGAGQGLQNLAATLDRSDQAPA